jgi:hypothetical protein
MHVIAGLIAIVAVVANTVRKVRLIRESSTFDDVIGHGVDAIMFDIASLAIVHFVGFAGGR